VPPPDEKSQTRKSSYRGKGWNTMCSCQSIEGTVVWWSTSTAPVMPSFCTVQRDNAQMQTSVSLSGIPWNGEGSLVDFALPFTMLCSCVKSKQTDHLSLNQQFVEVLFKICSFCNFLLFFHCRSKSCAFPCVSQELLYY
jgi:hypothetical protein